MYNLALHIKPSSSKKRKAAIIITYYEDGEAGAFMRTLKHRGIRHTFVAIRACSEEEYKAESHPYRLTLLSYDDWDMFIRDERKYITDPDWFQQLDQLRQQWPRFKRKPGEVMPLDIPKRPSQLQLNFQDL
jgi:hypothetical protein